MRGLVLAGALLALSYLPLSGQTLLDRSPNIHGVWGPESGRGTFVFAHRFELISGGDELASIPTLTLAAGLPLRLALGVDFTSYSEAIPDELSGNEAQFWLKRPIRITPGLDVAPLVAYNTAASSFDGALDLRVAPFRRLQIFAEGRAFSDLFGEGEAGAAGAIGAGIRLFEHLSLTGDVGKVLTEEDIPAAWSAAVAMEIPGSPHTFSLLVSNSGAVTLQGASREKTLGTEDIRYGFTFTVPLSPAGAWARIFRPLAPPPAPATAGAVPVQIRQFTYAPAEITVRQGQTVEWVNLDPDAHTVTGNDRSWDSGLLQEGERYTRTFDTPGRYPYFCIPHPYMMGTVVVE